MLSKVAFVRAEPAEVVAIGKFPAVTMEAARKSN
jgi:hypothetical protein